MSEIEKIQRYIERTDIKTEGQDRYTINMLENFELVHKCNELPADAIAMAFEYGKAKGYRAAKAEAHRG